MNIFEAPTNCVAPEFNGYDHCEKTVVTTGYLMQAEKEKWEFDLLLEILWDSMELAPNGEDLELDETVLIQKWLKKYRGFEYSVLVDKLKEQKKEREKKYGSRES